MNEADRKNITCVPFKGILLALQLYEKPEVRVSGDIDILFNVSQTKEIMQIFKARGYSMSIEKKEISFEDINEDYFKKTNQLFLSKKDIIVELHPKLVDSTRYDRFFKVNSDEVMSRVKKEIINNIEVQQLEIHDYVIYLIVHFYKHFNMDIHLYLEMGQIKNIVGQQIHDIVLLINKYYSKISWNIILNRVVQWDTIGPILLVSKLINYMYYEIIPQEFILHLLEEIDKNSTKSSYEIFARRVAKADVKDIFHFDIQKYLKCEFAPYANCYYISHEEFNNNAKKSDKNFFIDEYSAKTDKFFLTHLTSGIKPKTSSDLSAEGTISWDYEYLSIYAKINTSILTYSNNKNEYIKANFTKFSMERKKDSKELSTLIYLIVQPVVEENEVSLFIYNRRKGEIISKDIILNSVSLCESGYEFVINIPWTYINITPSRKLEIAFDIGINNVETNLSWSGNENLNLGSLVLK